MGILYLLVVYEKNKRDKPFKVIYKNGRIQYLSQETVTKLLDSLKEKNDRHHWFVDNVNGKQVPTDYFNRDQITSITKR